MSALPAKETTRPTSWERLSPRSEVLGTPDCIVSAGISLSISRKKKKGGPDTWQVSDEGSIVPEGKDIPDRLLKAYWLWGLAATVAFALFLAMLAFYYSSDYDSVLFLFVILLAGFLWIGATSYSRHSYIRLKEYMGAKVSLTEFISTQIIVLLLPFSISGSKRKLRHSE